MVRDNMVAVKVGTEKYCSLAFYFQEADDAVLYDQTSISWPHAGAK